MAKDSKLSEFVSGTRRFAPAPKPSLHEVLSTLHENLRRKPYKRSRAQKDAAKRISDRIMGERSDN